MKISIWMYGWIMWMWGGCVALLQDDIDGLWTGLFVNWGGVLVAVIFTKLMIKPKDSK